MIRAYKQKWRQVWSASSKGLRWLCVLALALAALRLALPYVVKSFLNRRLAQLPEYQGHVNDLRLHLWRGAYEVHDLEITKRSGQIQIPFFKLPRMELSVEWRALLHRSVVGEVSMRQPQLNFVAGPTKESTQTGEGAHWDKVLEGMFPFKLNRLAVLDGQIHFHNQHLTPPVDIYVRELSVVATNLSNARRVTGPLPGCVVAQGKTLGGGVLDLDLKLDPMVKVPTFEVSCQLTNVNLATLNDFLRAYGKFDVESGIFALYTSFAAKEGNYDGYLKVFFEDLDVFAWEKERKKNILQIFWQAIVGSVAAVFKNHPNDRLATRIPVSGTFDQAAEVGTWSAVGTLLRNAFIRALIPRLDEQKTIDEVPKKPDARPLRPADPKNRPPLPSSRTPAPSKPDRRENLSGTEAVPPAKRPGSTNTDRSASVTNTNDLKRQEVAPKEMTRAR